MLAVQPSPLSATIIELPTDLTPQEWSALAIAITPGGRNARRAACRQLHRVLDPLVKTGEAVSLDARAIGWVQRAVLRGMQRRHTACGLWDADDWIAVARTARTFRGNVVAVAWWLGRLTTEHIPAAGVRPTDLARRLFGRSVLAREVDRIRAHLRTIGYGRSAMSRRSLMTALSILFLRAGRAELEALTVEHIQDARRMAPERAEQRRMYYRVAHALHGMGLIPNAIQHRTYSSTGTTNIDPNWGGVVHAVAGNNDPFTRIREIRVLRHPESRSLAGSRASRNT